MDENAIGLDDFVLDELLMGEGTPEERAAQKEEWDCSLLNTGELPEAVAERIDDILMSMLRRVTSGKVRLAVKDTIVTN